MGKKGLKRKTRWRPLSISECADDTSTVSITNSTTETNIEEDDTYKYSAKNSSYLRRKPTIPFSTSSSNRTDYRNNYNNSNNNSNNYYRNTSNSSNKHNSTISSSTTSSLYSSSRFSSYRRRPFTTSNHQNDSSNNSNKYYSSRGSSRATSNRVHRTMSEPSDKENISLKPQLNEDEYTRITTPRQDVIFKKSYLNQPKRYLSSTDTNTTSSAAASVVSTEESISATSVPSLSPEQCSSMADSIDPEQAFMYSYFDQNGVFYVNPFLPNGFDQYGQMFMLPYGYSPYMYPQDINSPSASGDIEEISDELNETKSDLKDSNIDVVNNDEKLNKKLSKSCDSIQKTSINNDHNQKEEKEGEDHGNEDGDVKEKDEEDKITKKDEIINNENNTDNKNDGANNEKIEKETEETEETKETNRDVEIIPPSDSSTDYFRGYGGYQQFYPPIFYPYMYSQPFIPIFAEEFTNPVELYNGDHVGAKRRKRNKIDENSTDATTTDYSEDDEYTEEDDITETPEIIEAAVDSATSGDCELCDNYKENRSINNEETESKQIKFNTDVEEFVPRTNKPHLNVHVKEFKPRNYTASTSSADEQNSRTSEIVAESMTEVTSEGPTKETITEDSTPIKETTETFITSDAGNPSKVESQKTVEPLPLPQRVPFKEKSLPAVKISKTITKSNPPKDTEVRTEKSLQPLEQSAKQPTMTLAEKIKKTLSEESKLKSIQNLKQENTAVSVSPPSSSSNSRSITPKLSKTEKKFTVPTKKMNPKSSERPPPLSQRKKLSPRNNESRNQSQPQSESQQQQQTTTKSVSTYAQMLNNNNNSNKLSSQKNSKHSEENTITHAIKDSTKELPIESQTQEKTAAGNSNGQVWLTVKSRGKRGKQIKEVTMLEDEIIYEQDDALTVNQNNAVRDVAEVKGNNNSSPAIIVENSSVKPTENVEPKVAKDFKESSPESANKNDSSSTSSSQKKDVKSKSKKSRKSAPLNSRKLKGFELKEPKIEIGSAGGKKKSNEKERRSSSSSSFESQNKLTTLDGIDVETLLELTPTVSEEEDLTALDHIYGHHEKTKNNFARSFVHNSLDVLNGFDYKLFKGNSILKEEEEMVLNVIKSLSYNQNKFETVKTNDVKDESKIVDKVAASQLDEQPSNSNDISSDAIHESMTSEEELTDGEVLEQHFKSEGIDETTTDNENLLEISLDSVETAEKVVEDYVEQAQVDVENESESTECVENTTNDFEISVEHQSDVQENSTSLTEEFGLNIVDPVLQSNESVENFTSAVVGDLESKAGVGVQGGQTTENSASAPKADLEQSSGVEVSNNAVTTPGDNCPNGELSNFEKFNGIDEEMGVASTDVQENYGNQEETNVNDKISFEMADYTSVQKTEDVNQNQQLSVVVSEAEAPVCNGDQNESISSNSTDDLSADYENSNYLESEEKAIIASTNHLESNNLASEVGAISFQQETSSEEISVPQTNGNEAPSVTENVHLNGTLEENIENLDKSSETTTPPASKLDDSASNDFYQLIKLDDGTSTSIADQLKTIENQLKNLERIASVSSLNSSRNDISSDVESTASNLSTNHNLQTAEITITNSTMNQSLNNSIPSEMNHESSISDEGNSCTQQQIDSIDTSSEGCNDNDRSSEINSKNDILVPIKSHVLNGCENEFETRNNLNNNKSCSSHQQQQNQQLNGELHCENSSPIDRIRSNSLEGCCHSNAKSLQQHQVPEIIPVCDNTKSISDNSLNITTTTTTMTNSFPSTTCKYPLTNAVRQWLKDNTKEKTPEPILRIPINDPTISTKIKTSIQQQEHHNNNDHQRNDDSENDDWCSDEDAADGNDFEMDEIQNEENHPKNLLSNPSHVSSVKNINNNNNEINRYLKRHQKSLLSDDDSDYNSDSQQREDKLTVKRYDYDDNTCERVASLIFLSDTTTTDNEIDNESHQRRKNDDDKIVTPSPSSLLNNQQQQQQQQINKNDLLDYWDDEFIENPMKFLKKNTPKQDEENNKNNNNRKKRRKHIAVTATTANHKSLSSSSDETELSPYESVYGKTIDYNRLINENNYEFLSNTIISFNNLNDIEHKKQKLNNKFNDNNKNTSLNYNYNNNFDNNIKFNNNNNKNNNKNCLKPPEVCCILM